MGLRTRTSGPVLAALTAVLVAIVVPSTAVLSAVFDACVAPGGAGGCETSIQQAVYDVPDGGSIHVAPGTYSESVAVYGKHVTVVGDSAATTLVSGAAGSPTFTVFGNAAANLNGLTLTHAAGADGPGLYNDSPSTVLVDVVVRDNGVSGSGGGIVNWGSASLDRSTVSGNAATANGAGIVNGGMLSMSESTVHANATGTGGIGGGIYNTGSLTVARSTIDGNSSPGGAGGGVASFAGLAPVVFDTATVAGNSAAAGGGFSIGGGNLRLKAVTLAGNTASTTLGANLYADGATVAVDHTIVSGSNAGNCVLFAATFTSGGGNLDSGTSCGFAGSGDLTATDPKLGSLDDNGGPTRTMALLAGSPAIDAGAGGCAAVDQRGVARPQRVACDIGAFEAGPVPVVTIAAPVNGSLLAVGQQVAASYGCTDALTGSPVLPCTGTVPVGALLDTSSVGARVVTVNATDRYGFVGTAQAKYTVVSTVRMGPQSMEGDLKLAPGTLLGVGYDFTLPGSHPQVTVKTVGSSVRFTAGCATGSGGGVIVVAIPDSSTTVPASSSAWYPSGDQHSSLVYQGSITVPDVCHGGVVRLQQGGTFVAGFASSDGKTKVNVRWHYSAKGSAGGWSGTQSIVPTLAP
jgi:hypothetical protein